MKYLVRFNKENNKYIDMVTVNEVYTHKYYDIEPLEEKDGFYIKTYYDEKNDKVDQQYVEIPKTQEELIEEEMKKMKEQMEQNAKALEDLLMQSTAM